MKLAVIGRGLIGAAAARHLAEAGHDITLIGPSEPIDRAAHNGVFASHYDEGRITRLLDPDPLWQELAAASMARYAEIEARSGVDFYTPAGLLIGGPADHDYVAAVRRLRDERGVTAAALDDAGLRAAFPFLDFAPNSLMFHQSQNAGHISPRRLVAAQSLLAAQAGAKLIDDYALHVEGGRVETSRARFDFDRVLVAGGGFTNMMLTRPLALAVQARTVMFFRLEAAQAAQLAGMPAIILRRTDGAVPYILPPIKYPDGQIYVKIGGEPEDKPLADTDAIKAWFKSSGNPEVGAFLQGVACGLIPSLAGVPVHSESCVVTDTKTGHPYIGEIDPQTVVATGGCGGAAKSSDEIGRIAAQALLGAPDLRFKCHFAAR